MQETDKAPPLLNQWFREGVTHLQAGRWGDAEAVYRRILAKWPNVPEAYHNLAMVQVKQRKFDEAVKSYRRALELRPNSPDACNSLGDALRELHRPEEAAETYRQAIALRPDFAAAWNSLGSALKDMAKPTEAIEAHHRALALKPGIPEPWNNIGNALREMNRLGEAIEAYRKALTLRPEFPEPWSNMGNTLRELNRPMEAIEAYRRALNLRPEFAEAWSNLGSAFWQTNQLTQAVKSFRQALALRPDHGQAWNNLALALKDMGQLDEALACLERAIVIQPSDVEAQSNRLHTLHYHPGYDSGAIFREAQRWNDRFAYPLSSEIPTHQNDRTPKRRLRIGYVSPDFRRHCESLFTMPLLANHDHREFEIFCYSSVPTPDAVTARLRSHADTWRDIMGQTDPAAAEMIRHDGIDILVDLALHTARNRLRLFARKPAPIQVTWLGYPGTTGLEAIDYRLTDPRLDPLDSGELDFSTKEPYYSERSVRLPDCFWCYDPHGMEDSEQTALPEPGPLPALAAGRVTFGCLNNFCKVSDWTLGLWGKAMAAVPNSRLLLVAPPESRQERLFQKLGVARDRVEFVPHQEWRQYMETYRRIDICLDTLPYNGGTTSFETLWMGVPVLTRVGQTVVGRAGSSLLHNLDLPDLVARSDDQFVQQAVGWAGDLDRLSGLRATLRSRVEKSPLMDGPRFARNVEAAYRQMWEVWCRG